LRTDDECLAVVIILTPSMLINIWSKKGASAYVVENWVSTNSFVMVGNVKKEQIVRLQRIKKIKSQQTQKRKVFHAKGFAYNAN
jgi:hypothetical protein